MNTFMLIFFSAALGCGAAAWYYFFPRLRRRGEFLLERLKPNGGASLSTFEFGVSVLVLFLVIVPFGLLLWAPSYAAKLLGVNGFGATVGAWGTAFLSFWASNRAL